MSVRINPKVEISSKDGKEEGVGSTVFCDRRMILDEPKSVNVRYRKIQGG